MTERILSESESAFLRTLRRGQTVQGTVTEIAPFGVTFVNIGDFTAMINIPELSWRYIDRPSDVVAVGQEVTAEVLDVDFGRGRVFLSLKALQDDPFQELQQWVGHVVTGPVTKVVPFGVFVRVEDVKHGFEGLLPCSELEQSTVEVGDLLTVRIAQVDIVHRRIALTLSPMVDPGEDGQ